MSLCDDLYNQAQKQLTDMYGRFDEAMLDRGVVRLLCEQVEKLIADSHRHNGLEVVR